jgi:ribosomal protein S18 acetylase RimI-like enzyme
LGSGEGFRLKLSDIPWTDAFLSSKILVAGVGDEGEVEAVCGIRGVFNILTLYVREWWRGRGIGNQILRKAIDIARERGLGFILLGVSYGNTSALHLYCKFGFKEVVYLKKSGLKVMMLPLDLVGEVAYAFLWGITRSLPNVCWTYTAQWVHDATVIDPEGD